MMKFNLKIWLALTRISEIKIIEPDTENGLKSRILNIWNLVKNERYRGHYKLSGIYNPFTTRPLTVCVGFAKRKSSLICQIRCLTAQLILYKPSVSTRKRP